MYLLRYIWQKKNMKKFKNIELSESAIKTLTIRAVESGTVFKKYVEDILENIAKPKKKSK
jgi:hypothetical protein